MLEYLRETFSSFIQMWAEHVLLVSGSKRNWTCTKAHLGQLAQCQIFYCPFKITLLPAIPAGLLNAFYSPNPLIQWCLMQEISNLMSSSLCSHHVLFPCGVHGIGRAGCVAGYFNKRSWETSCKITSLRPWVSHWHGEPRGGGETGWWEDDGGAMW